MLQTKVVDGQTYLMEQLGGLRRAIPNVGLWFGPDRPSSVTMTLALTSPSGGCGKARGAEEGKLNSGVLPPFNTPLFNRTRASIGPRVKAERLMAVIRDHS